MPAWATLPVTTSATGYAFAALFYFVCCYGMSRYAGGWKHGSPARRSALRDLR